MRRLVILVLVLLAVHTALLFVRPSQAASPIVGEGLDVGVVFDVGGRGDKSFNDGAFLGAERAIRELGARVRYIEPGEGTDRE
ncbi:MAG TPA: BMP family ABC transporter substrate-binding protein, partial [Gemmatimonadaceae bacterium]